MPPVKPVPPFPKALKDAHSGDRIILRLMMADADSPSGDVGVSYNIVYVASSDDETVAIRWEGQMRRFYRENGTSTRDFKDMVAVNPTEDILEAIRDQNARIEAAQRQEAEAAKQRQPTVNVVAVRKLIAKKFTEEMIVQMMSDAVVVQVVEDNVAILNLLKEWEANQAKTEDSDLEDSDLDSDI